ncbi:hypothetical protein ACYZUD_20700 [Pseudomonas sp. XS1P51]
MSAASNYATYICAGTVILVANELSESHSQDGLDSLLYSQTVASRKFPDFAQSDLWINASRIAMKTLGGILFSEPNISLPVPASGAFTLGEMAQQVLRQLVSPTAEQSLKTSLVALSQCAPDSPESTLLHEHMVQNQRRVQFKFGVMSPGVAVAVAAISFEFDEVVAGNLFSHRFSHEKVIGNVLVGGYKALVESEDYDLSRATVISLLGTRRQEQIIKLA